MANEIWAAIIQAVPIAGAALVGWRGLSTWRTQLRVEHTVQALAAAAAMFRVIRDARAPRARWITKRRLNHDAWIAWERFQERYTLAQIYCGREKPRVDVAVEVRECIAALQRHAKAMWNAENAKDELSAAKERQAFHWDASQPPDHIEEQLQKAEQELQAELGAIRVKAHDTSNGTSSLDLDVATEQRLVDALRGRALNAREIKVITKWVTSTMRPGLQGIANKRGLALDVRSGLGGGVLYRFYKG